MGSLYPAYSLVRLNRGLFDSGSYRVGVALSVPFESAAPISSPSPTVPEVGANISIKNCDYKLANGA